jgi:hypothetical protein
MDRDLACLHEPIPKPDHEVERARRPRKFHEIGVQIGLSKPVERKHLVEFTVWRRIIDIDDDRHGRNDKAAKA